MKVKGFNELLIMDLKTREIVQKFDFGSFFKQQIFSIIASGKGSVELLVFMLSSYYINKIGDNMTLSPNR